jgi:hypothetical protein
MYPASLLLAVSLLPAVRPSPPAAPAGPRTAAQSRLACPESTTLELDSGSHLLTGPCTVRGIALSGEAALTVESPDFVVDGDVTLRGRGILEIRNSTWLIANHSAFEHRLEARDDARLEVRNSTVSTNTGVDASLPAQYTGYDRSVFRLERTEFSLSRSWLLADLFDGAVLEAVDSAHLPTETYPHDSATVTIAGPGSDNGIWLEFAPGTTGIVERIPDKSKPFKLGLGRGTPGWANVGWRVDVVDGIATFGVQSAPHSDVTIRDNGSPVPISYLFANVAKPERLVGLVPGPQNGRFEHQGRVLELVRAALEGFAWQIYSSNTELAAPEPVEIIGSVVNEVGAMENGRIKVDRSVLQWALVAAIGEGSRIEVVDSTVNSQTILAERDGVVRVSSSAIYGSLVQARDQARIYLLNDDLRRNLCHGGCVPLCPPQAGGGCNPFKNPGQEVQFLVEGEGRIVVLGLDPVVDPISRGRTHAFTGDVILEQAGGTGPYSYSLVFAPRGGGETTTLARGVPGPRRRQALATLDTGALAPGDYVARLQMIASGAVLASVDRPFTIADP